MDPTTRTTSEVLSQRYELRRRLGSGGAGVVFAAHDRVLDRPVAVKLLRPELAGDPDAARRFRTEAVAAGRIAHPNAVAVYDIGRDDERDFLVMELVEGPTLAAVLTTDDGQRTALAWPTVAAIGWMVASALGSAHARGTVHRDIKPANVLLNATGTAKVADFGIARALGDAAAGATAPGTVLGTARYLAPEQLRDVPVDARADVYALGLTLHEALTGLPPWGEGSATEIATRRLTGDLPPPSATHDGVPPGLDTVVAHATRLAPDERYADGSRLAAALAPFVPDDAEARLTRLAAPAGAAPPTPPPPPTGRPAPGRHHGADRTAALHDGRASDGDAGRASDGDGEVAPTTVVATDAPAAPAGSPRRRRRRRSATGRIVATVLVAALLGGLALAGAVGTRALLDEVPSFDLDGLTELVDDVLAGASER